MTRLIGLILTSLLLFIVESGAAAAIVSCSASAVPVVFAPVGTLTTANGAGGIDVSCGGGTDNETVYLCLTLGQGSAGGSGAGTNVRYLDPSQSSPSYNLATAGSQPLAAGIKAALGSMTLASGSQSGSFPISGTIDWAGFVGDPVSLTSSFTATDVWFAYGATSDCQDGESQISSFSATAAYYGACEVSASAMDFGALSPSNPTASSRSNIFITCPSGTAYTVDLGSGQNAGQSPVAEAGRAMSNGTDYLGYDLYESVNASTPWSGLGGTGSSNTQSIEVYGRIPAGQSGLSVGTYSDTVVVTVTY